MAQTITSSTFTTTYKDDFSDSAGYYRILFNSGVALQARELTQVQTIIDKQIERMGNNLFVDGAAVQPGGQSIFNVEYITLQDLTNYPLPVDGNGVLNKSAVTGVSFTGQTSNITFTIDDIAEGFVENSVTYPASLYVNYTNTSSNTGDTTSAPRVQAGEILRANDGSGREFKVSNSGGVVNHVGFANKFSVGSSIHYAKGFFVYSTPQEIYVNRFSNKPTAEIGYKVVEDVVSVADDTSLYDNQGTSPNLTAPGADRYRIRLVLTKRADVAAGETFIFLADIKNGVITSQVDAFTAYKIPRDLIAKRIKENSGDYLVQPYTVQFLSDSDNNYLRLKHSQGIAVIDGYRVETQRQGFIRVPKATSTRTRTDDIVAMGYGNYVEVEESNTSGLPDISSFTKLTLKTGAGWTGTSIGTARVRAITYDAASNYYRFYLFDIKTLPSYDFGDTGSIGTSTSSYFDLRQVGGKAQLNSTFNNTLFVSLPANRPASISDVDVTVQRQINISHTGSAGTIQANSTNANLTGAETFTDVDLWYWSYADSSINQITGTYSGGGVLTDQVDLSVTAANGSGTNVTVYGYVRDPNAQSKTKTLTDRSMTISSLDSDGYGLKYLNLHRADVYSVTEVIDAADSSKDLRGSFSFDTGQRDNYYGVGRLVLKGGKSDPTLSGPVHVKYKYFTHGNGKFFSKSSYDNAGVGFGYKDIQTYTTADGYTFNLRDVLDFRPVADSDGNFSDTTTGAQVTNLPRVNDTIEIGSASYYSPRKDRLILDKTGVINYMLGASGTGKSPPTPIGAMSLFEFALNPNTLYASDLQIRKEEHKRYTMKDISRLERRVDKIEEYTTLSLLETDAINFSVLDDSGNDRLKSGILADNFSTHLLSDVNAPNNQFNASIDWRKGHLHPSVAVRNITLVYDSDNSVNTIRKGDKVLIDYDEELYLDQNQISSDTFINEFEVRNYVGNMTLSPSSDTWYDYRRVPRKIIPQAAKIDVTDAYNWNHFEHDWNGTPLEDLEVGDQTTTFEITYSGNKAKKTYNKVVGTEVIEEFIEDKVIERTTIRTMRSKKVYFKVTSLRPNTQYFAFFNGVSVADFVREETFRNFADDATDYSSGYFKITEHPDGKSTLISDAEGKIEGSFFIPSTETLKFATGTAVFKLLDVSADNGKAISQASTAYTSLGEILTMREEWHSTEVIDIDGVTDVITNSNTGSGGDGNVTGGSAGWHNYNEGFWTNEAGDVLTHDDWSFTGLDDGIFSETLNSALSSGGGLTTGTLMNAQDKINQSINHGYTANFNRPTENDDGPSGHGDASQAGGEHSNTDGPF